LGSSDEQAVSPDQSGLFNTVTSLTRKRVQLNMKILGMQLGSSAESQNGQMVQEKQSYREQFLPPELSMLNKILTKVIKKKY
jgi:hypothetical protein